MKLLKNWKKKGGMQEVSCAMIVVAAGSADRMDGKDKILYPLGGSPVLIHSLRLFQVNNRISEIIVVTREDNLVEVSRLCRYYGIGKVKTVVAGGETRSQSVMAGLREVARDIDLVAVHDGARPLITASVLNETLDAAIEYRAAAPAIPLYDTVKSARDGVVERTVRRNVLYAVQTPQIFDSTLLRQGLERAERERREVSDDCSAVEAMGFPVHLTHGSVENLKLTTPEDIHLAEAVLLRRAQA